MHILQIVCTDAFAGTERHVLTASLALRAAGHDVTVIGGSADQMRGSIVDAGARWLPGTGVRSAVAAARRLTAVDVIATHLSAADLTGALVSRRLGAPVVSTRHMAQQRGRGAVQRAVLRRASRRITAQISVSAHVAAQIEGSSTVIHAGVAPRPARRGARQPRVLVAQRLEQEKRTDVVLRAWALLGDAAEGWSLKIAGDGTERHRLERLAVDLGVDDVVRFLGHRSDIPVLMSEAGIFVASAPSEHYGLSVLEAMAGGTPVVATASAGHLETIGTVADAALFPPDDERGLAERLRELIRDEARRERYGAAGRIRQREAFTVERQIDQTLAVYERARTR